MGTYGGAEMASSFETVRNNTIQIANDIPEASYDFVPAPGTQSVRALLVHIAMGPTMYEDLHRYKHVTTLVGYDFPGIIARIKAAESKPRSKADIVALLKSEGDRFAAWLRTLSPGFLAETFTDHAGHAKTRLEGLLSPKEHEMHHRGQLMLAERMLGIVPHLTRLREERARQPVS
jgi:uncharacterized damage-inducible protein DinB